MDTKDEKNEKGKGSCCTSSGCGGHCCGGRAALALVLLLIGGLIGFAMGHCGGFHRGYCPMMMSAPSAPTK